MGSPWRALPASEQALLVLVYLRKGEPFAEVAAGFGVSATTDGTLIATDRIAVDRPFHSGKHRHHGVNLQVIATPDGDISWICGDLPDSTHDTAAARIWPSRSGPRRSERPGRQGLPRPRRGRKPRDHPIQGQGQTRVPKAANRAHAQLRAPAERANPQLKNWRILRQPRCCPDRAGRIAKAIHALLG